MIGDQNRCEDSRARSGDRQQDDGVAQSLDAAGFSIRSQIICAKERLVLSRGEYYWLHAPCWYAVR